MRGFIDFALGCAGYQSISVLVPTTPHRDYTVIGKFADESARRAFTATPEYAAWMARLAELTDGDMDIVEHSVLDEWVRSPAAASTISPPKWKTAVATFIGVYPVVTALNFILEPALKSWPLVVSSAVAAACVVALLTWVVMPIVSRLVRPWLYPTATTTPATSSTNSQKT
jgi:antibiotic biosynthesis monooxygenase (ABM) superfamily enzyme